MNDKRYALVTGASQGLGKAFAVELARKGIDLLLVSLPEQGLARVSQDIRDTYRVDVRYFETDLTEMENVLGLARWANDHFRIYILINNAGTGGTRKITEADADYIRRIIQLNVLATSMLTHQLLPNLLRQPEGYILNVSSLAAFSPIGYKTVYPASKSYIHSFSRGLFQELKGTSVFVSVVNPGAMKTNPEITSRVEKQGLFGRLTLLEPEKVARICVKKLFRKDSVIVVNPISWSVLHLLPIWIKMPLLTRTIKREIA
ncbi:SDR family NAD(P)-dependent oxidoreductase [Larkinella soli]|uniref:SDR family NAD(P)-dependent oxidoreductase n=1 Tax=Larkinella soli TaxID=1770527 RepID=UPI000FFB19D1|nr:SDR family NAD(P)-dependent oxidoreductase [Larkinella soli]